MTIIQGHFSLQSSHIVIIGQRYIFYVKIDSYAINYHSVTNK